MYVRSLFGLDLFLDVLLRDFLIAFLSSPYRELPKNANKNPKGGKQ
jgi:hypothetical protein